MLMSTICRWMYWVLLSGTVLVPLSVGMVIRNQFAGIVQGGHWLVLSLVLLPFVVFHAALSGIARFKNNQRGGSESPHRLGKRTSLAVAAFATLHLFTQVLNGTDKGPIIVLVVTTGFALVVVLPLLLWETVHEMENTKVY